MKMGRVLVIEDSDETRKLIMSGLSDTFEMIGAPTIAKGREIVAATELDLVLLDVALPDGNGIKWLADLRNSPKGQELPVIFISGGMDVDERVLGFTLGAEDVILKPFHTAELKARILARIRLRKKLEDGKSQIVRGNIRVDTPRQAVWIGDNPAPVELTSHEFKILCFLASRPDAVYTRNQIIDGAWGSDVHIYERTVDSHISRLRRKLQGASHNVHAVRGTGYRFGPNGGSEEDC